MWTSMELWSRVGSTGMRATQPVAAAVAAAAAAVVVAAVAAPVAASDVAVTAAPVPAPAEVAIAAAEMVELNLCAADIQWAHEPRAQPRQQSSGPV